MKGRKLFMAGIAGLAMLTLVLLFALGNLQARTIETSAPKTVTVGRVARQAEPVDPLEDNTSVTIDLESGFLLDPYLVRVIGTGDTAASEIQEGCAGFVGTEANVTLNWSGDSEELYLFTYSDSDPVLVVETPSGEILCSDDANDVVVDSLIALKAPEEGTYNVHVGSFAADEPAMGFLVITELNVVDDLAAMDLAPLLDRQDYPDLDRLLPEVDINDLALGDSGIFGDSVLEPGFETIEVYGAGGGDLAVASLDGLDSDCVGFVSLVPTYSFTWSGGGNLSTFFESEEDGTLIVVTPEGVVCNDNASDDNLNPVVDIPNAAEGSYDVYVGTQIPNTIVTGTLTITANTSAEPGALSPGS